MVLISVRFRLLFWTRRHRDHVNVKDELSLGVVQPVDLTVLSGVVGASILMLMLLCFAEAETLIVYKRDTLTL